MSRHGPQSGSIRPAVAGERLTTKQRRALILVGKAGYVDDRQLQALIGPYSRNVIKSLEERGLIALEGKAVPEWQLTKRGREIVGDVELFDAGA